MVALANIYLFNAYMYSKSANCWRSYGSGVSHRPSPGGLHPAARDHGLPEGDLPEPPQGQLQSLGQGAARPMGENLQVVGTYWEP